MLTRGILLAPLAAVLFQFAPYARAGESADLGWARENAKRGRYADAIKLYRKAIEADAENIDVRLELGRVLLVTGDYKGAAELGRSAVKSRADSTKAQTFLGEALMELGSHADAINAYEEALRLDEKNMRARWGLAEALRMTGKKKRAHELTNWFFKYYEENDVADAEALMYVALAAKDDDPKEAFRLLGNAIKKDPSNEEIYVARGFLAIERYSFSSARRIFGQLLAKNKHHPLAHVGMSHVLLASGKNDDAQKELDKALEVNPNLIPALIQSATLNLIDENYHGTPEAIAKAAQVNPTSLEALSMQAAFAHIKGDAAKRDEIVKKVLSINPFYSDIYIAIARAAERKRNMPDAVEWGRKAIGMSPGDWQGHFVVGMNLLRQGREREGYRILEEAHKLNKFNVWARNMLVCMDKDFRKHQYESFTTEHFVVKLHKSESQILGPYITSALEEMYAELTEKYRFKPEGTQEGRRILISFFPEHNDFSARTVGLPGLGALGACMGQVVTMPSPRVGVARGARGLFNWERVLEHEFTHVITLQMTDYGIPRWFTEGISVWEEADPQLKWDMLFKMALANGQLLPLEKINRGFTRPSYPTQVPASYYQASLIVQYFVETHGMDGLIEMCRLFREKKRTPEVMEKVTGKPLAELDKTLMEYLEHHARSIRTPVPPTPPMVAKLTRKVAEDPKDADSRAALAAASLSARRNDKARELAKAALAINPKVARAHNVLGYMALRVDRNNAAAEKHFRAAAKADDEDYYSRFALGYMLSKDGREREALPFLEKSIRIFPRNTTTSNLARQNPYHLLGGLYQDQEMIDKAVSVYRRAMDTDHTDMISAKHLGALLMKTGDAAGALAAFERCFEINPFEAGVHVDAARAAEKLGRLKIVTRECRVALHIDGKNFDAALMLARSLKAGGDKAGALEAARKAVEIDPDNAEAKRLLDSLE